MDRRVADEDRCARSVLKYEKERRGNEEGNYPGIDNWVNVGWPIRITQAIV